MPSSEGQPVLALQLIEELKVLGVKDIKIHDTEIITVILLSNLNYYIPTIAFLDHLVTNAEKNNNKKTKILSYKGSYLCLNK
ncbi:hypothetical protein [Proteus hauseri]|uniref:hypothetical protein n=1 Tax=Proteus hauseri TaxID=183417 RepID=UPI001FC917B8|nr:hypothetical protein [Proteus hauseri]